MDAAAVSHSKRAASELLLAHCFVLDGDEGRRPPAAQRLELMVGSDLARRLIAALTGVR